MAITKPHSTVLLILRSIVPSSTSGILCVFAGVITVLIGVFTAAGQVGSGVIDVHIGSGLHIAAITSLDRMLSRGSWGDVAIIVIGVLVLLLIFGVVEFLFGGYARLQDATKKTPEHSTALRLDTSEQRWLLDRAVWRMVIGLIAIVVAMLLVRLTHWVSGAEKATVSEISLTKNIWRMAFSTVVWALVYHCIVVFIRLYSLRTRVFGDQGLY